MKKQINWGIIALGKIAHKFAADLSLVKNANLLAVASRDATKSKVFAEKHKAEKYYGSYEELAKDSSVDVVYIASPHSFHFEHAKLCLENGKHVLCEKPMGMNAGQIKELIKIARSNNLFLMEALWTRFIPSFIKCKELIDKGKIGKIEHIQADFGFKVDAPPEGRLLNSELGGGALLDIGIYPVFLALTIIGTPDEIQAHSFLGPTGTDMNTSILFQWNKEKILANLSCSFNTNTPVEAVISGTEGRIKLHRSWHNPTAVELIRNEKSKWFKFKEPGNGYEYEIIEVQKCLEADSIESKVYSLQNSLDLHTTLDRIRQKTGLKYESD
jgi:predicted dehydrogenase